MRENDTYKLLLEFILPMNNSKCPSFVSPIEKDPVGPGDEWQG